MHQATRSISTALAAMSLALALVMAACSSGDSGHQVAVGQQPETTPQITTTSPAPGAQTVQPGVLPGDQTGAAGDPGALPPDSAVVASASNGANTDAGVGAGLTIQEWNGEGITGNASWDVTAL